MDLLFRLSRDVEEFENIENAKIFFKDTLPKKNNYYFYSSKKILKLRKNDQIYFSYDNYIIAKAIFYGKENHLDKKNDKYVHGYKIKDIEVLDLKEQLNHRIVHTWNIYINSEEKKQEISRILNSKIYKKKVISNALSINFNDFLDSIREAKKNSFPTDNPTEYNITIDGLNAAFKYRTSKKTYPFFLIEYNRKNAVLYIDIIKNESLQLTIPKSVYPCVKNKITNLIKQSELQKYPITRKHTGWFSFGFRLNHIKLTNKEKQEFTNIVKELLIYFGKKQDHLGIYYERNPKLRKQAISCHGRTCKACNFNFGTTYGVHGEGFIEVHHINPLAEIGTQHKVNPKTDLIPLCSNCHRMVHRRKDFLTIPELKSIIKK